MTSIDKKSKNKKICLIAAIIFFILFCFVPDIALGMIILGVFALICIYFARYFYYFPKYFKLTRKSYPLKDDITKDIIFNNTQRRLIESGFIVRNTNIYLVVESPEFKNIEYRIYVYQNKKIFKVMPYYNFKGRLLHGRFSPYLYKSAVINNDLIASIIQDNI